VPDLFKRFFRLEESRSTPGHGLGLALVAAIAELHGAKIAVRDNRPGLLVEVAFPAAPRSDNGAEHWEKL
jgi:signal transduction histidine kinase